ncbi:Non-specific protein-tyrosine kinase [Modestobacter italicus]|uniref:Non-specific protein-tyrosine kinase n=1 Tax=Modestobacter italicus (strain DSM 44449 / CECT 9708 / BC 501) TaxID=2732864 RepID=I4EXK5_MODI5|nr:polysaccharide biosynthesis tyrosine autokinase [Modestobacter marinus]CCH88118.1 Non-specific protein-tyrosine kinase [Modestobacter marinus]
MDGGQLLFDDVLETIRARKRWIAGGVLLGVLLAALLSWTAERTYSSTSRLFVSVTGPPDQTAPLDADTFAQQRMASYVRVLTGEEMAQRVVDDLRLPLTADQLAQQIAVTPLPGTVILQVTVTDSAPQRAQDIAESLQRQFTARLDELETPDGRTTPTVQIETLQAPDFDPEPTSPGWRRNVMLGAALGLLLGSAAALARQRTDTTVRREEQVRRSVGTELLGRVFEDQQRAAHPVSPVLDGESLTAEAYRALRVNLRHVEGGAPQVVVVTSALPGEGASTVAVRLSVSLARSGSRVLLVDGNLRRPRVARYLGLDEHGPGLTDVLAGTADLREATQAWGDGRLVVLGAGPLPTETDAVLDSARLRGLLGVLRDSHDFVVIDTPPLLPVIDAAAVSALADGCLLVVRFGRTREADLTEAAVTLERVHARLLGVVLNRVPRGRDIEARGRAYPADADRGGPDVPDVPDGDDDGSRSRLDRDPAADHTPSRATRAGDPA